MTGGKVDRDRATGMLRNVTRPTQMKRIEGALSWVREWWCDEYKGAQTPHTKTRAPRTTQERPTKTNRRQEKACTQKTRQKKRRTSYEEETHRKEKEIQKKLTWNNNQEAKQKSTISKDNTTSMGGGVAETETKAEYPSFSRGKQETLGLLRGSAGGLRVVAGGRGAARRRMGRGRRGTPTSRSGWVTKLTTKIKRTLKRAVGSGTGHVTEKTFYSRI